MISISKKIKIKNNISSDSPYTSKSFPLQVKLSLYSNNTEVAWVTFHKLSDSRLDWLNSSNVIDAHPWDADMLRSSTTVFNIDPNSQ